MPLNAVILILLSAVLHAGWNLIAKKTRMSVPFYAVLASTGAMLWCHVLFWTPVRLSALPAQFWIFTLCAAVGDAVIYCNGLSCAYDRMEMSTAYPIARSLPILFTMLITTVFGLGDRLTACAVTGMTVVFAGCMVMPLKTFSEFSFKKYCSLNILFVLMAACGTTCYTVSDKLALNSLEGTAGAECSGVACALTYYIIRNLAMVAILWTTTAARGKNREILSGMGRKNVLCAVFAGVCGSLTYTLVLEAMTFVSNVSYVQVLRQAGLIFGVLGGVLLLKEKCPVTKITGTAVIILGLVMTSMRT